MSTYRCCFLEQSPACTRLAQNFNRKRLAVRALIQQLMLAWYKAGVRQGEREGGGGAAGERAPVGVPEGLLSDIKALSAMLPTKKGTCKVS